MSTIRTHSRNGKTRMSLSRMNTFIFQKELVIAVLRMDKPNQDYNGGNMEKDYEEYEIAEDLNDLCQRPLTDCVDCMECWEDRN
jgi:hypothetical protein